MPANASADTTSDAPFDINALLAGLKDVKDDKSNLDVTKLQGKNAISLAQLQGQLQQQLAKQQNEYQQAQQAQQNAYNLPLQSAALTGQYNGAPTLAAQQQAQQNNQFQQSLTLQAAQGNDQTALGQAQLAVTAANNANNTQLGQATLALQASMQTRQANLAELAQQQKNAIDQGNLDLANRIQTQTLALQQQQEADQVKLQTATQSGYLDNGNLTEAARAARAQEANQNTATMGVDASGNQTLASRAQQQNNAIAAGALTGQYVDPTTGQPMTTEQAREFEKSFQLQQSAQSGVMGNGQLTDASQQWRQQQALSALQTQAQLQANPSNYFESALYNRGLQGSGALTFMPDVQNLANGSNAGFRSANYNLPQTGSLSALASGQQTGTQQGMAQQAPQGNEGAPSASVANAQNAYAGNQAAYSTSMNVPSMQGGTAQQMAGQQGGQAYAAGGQQQLGMYGQGQGDLASQQLAAFKPTFAQGAQKLAPGSLEAMNPSERALFQSAAGASGINAQDFETQYKRSRLQTGVSGNQV